MRIDPSKMDSYSKATARFVPLALSEPGCIACHYSVDVTDPTVVYIHQIWESLDAQRAHVASTYHADRMEESKEWEMVAEEIKLYDISLNTDVLESRRNGGG